MNSKILLSDFIIECQLIEEILKKIILLISKKINDSLNTTKHDIKYKINKNKLEKLSLGGLIRKLRQFTDDTIITDLDNLRKKRNKIVHYSFYKLLEETESLKIKENEKDIILNKRLYKDINEGIKMSSNCWQKLFKLLKKL
jgi:actin-like ATPase involved in cell morphogenesis